MFALSFTVAMILMCKGHLEDKYRGMYHCIFCQLRLLDQFSGYLSQFQVKFIPS